MGDEGSQLWSERVQEREDEEKAFRTSRNIDRTPPPRERRAAAQNNQYAPAAPAAPAAKKHTDKLKQPVPTSRVNQGRPNTPTPTQRSATPESPVPQKAKSTAAPNGKHDTRLSKDPVPTPSSSAMDTPPREPRQRSGTVIYATPEYMEEQECQENSCLQHSHGNELEFSECISMAGKAAEWVAAVKVTKAAQQEHAEVQNMMNDLIKRLEQMEAIHNSHTKRAGEREPIMERLDRIERERKAEMQELRELLMKPKTFAEAAASNVYPTSAKTAPKPLNRPMLREHTEQTKVEQAKRELTLTTEEMDSETKKQLESMTSKEIVEKLQQAINETNVEGTVPKIQAANKLQNGCIKIFCRTVEEAKTLKETEWNTSIKGLKTKIPKYGIVVHGVPNEVVNFNADKQATMAEIEETNHAHNIPITDITPLRRKPNFVNTARYQSIIIFTSDADAADRCIKANELFIASGRYRAERYTPHLQITQCFKCYGYGHRAQQCRHEHKCGKCTGTHETNSCTNNKIKCVNCEENHQAWRHDCPKRVAESRRLAEIKLNTSAFFST